MGKRPGQMWNQSTGGKEMDSEYDSFLKVGFVYFFHKIFMFPNLFSQDMGWGPKKAKTEEGPYVPPMGDPGLRGLGGSQGPKVGGRLGWKYAWKCLMPMMKKKGKGRGKGEKGGRKEVEEEEILSIFSEMISVAAEVSLGGVD